MAKFDNKYRNSNKKKSMSSIARRNAKFTDNTNAKPKGNKGKIIKPQKTKRHKKLKAYEEPTEDVNVNIWANQWKADKQKESNQKPKNENDQEIPKAVLEIKKWKELPNKAKQPKKKKKNNNKSFQDQLMTKHEKGMTVPLKKVPNFEQKLKESDSAFLHRVERQTIAVIKRSQFEDKFEINSTGDGSTENKMVGKKKEREHNRLKEKKLKKKAKLAMKRNEDSTDLLNLKDDIKFGEVAMEPPSFTSKPRKAESTQDRPGKRSLLLKEIMSQNTGQSSNTHKRQVGKTLKRKNMSLAQQRLMDIERDKAIELYRNNKLQKIKLKG